MAEKKGVGHAYNVDFLNVVFAASSLFLFLSVIWMVWDDFDREWKNTQRRFSQLEYQVTQAQLELAGRSVDRKKMSQLEAQQRAAQQTVAQNQAKGNELTKKQDEADKDLYRATLDYQYAKANYDQDRYAFEAARADKKTDQNDEKRITDQAKRLNDLELARQAAEARKAAIQKELAQYTGKLGEV